SSEDETSNSKTIPNKRSKKIANKKEKSVEFSRAPFEPINSNNTIPTSNVLRPYQPNQDFAYNQTNYPRSSYNTIDPALLHNSDYIPPNISIQSNFSNQSSAYNTTHLSNENANRLQASS
ncbi:40208_t:CDS:2, partial [Gigaspora margarita]